MKEYYLEIDRFIPLTNNTAKLQNMKINLIKLDIGNSFLIKLFILQWITKIQAFLFLDI
jgi:hypothetical protein